MYDILNDAVILMVEDDAGHAALLKRVLVGNGITNEILHFEDGLKVVNFLNMEGDGPKRVPQKAYVVLLDIRMPIMDGIEVLRRMKNDDNLKAIPVIMVTTTDEPETIEECYQLGCANYIVKPADFGLFRSVIKDLAEILKTVEVPVLG